MKAILRLLFGAFTLRLAGAALLGLVIWYAGPLLAFAGWHPLETREARLITIAVVLALWLGKRLLTLLRQKVFNRKLLDALAPAPRQAATDEAESEDLHAVRERFAQALGIMRHASLGTRQPSLPARLAGSAAIPADTE